MSYCSSYINNDNNYANLNYNKVCIIIIVFLIHLILFTRRSWNIFELGKQYGTRDHVLLLHDVRDGTTIPKIPLVEKAFDHHPTGQYIFIYEFYLVLSREPYRNNRSLYLVKINWQINILVSWYHSRDNTNVLINLWIQTNSYNNLLSCLFFTAPVHSCVLPLGPSAVPRLRVPENSRSLAVGALHYFLRPVFRFLHQGVQEEPTATIQIAVNAFTVAKRLNPISVEFKSHIYYNVIYFNCYVLTRRHTYWTNREIRPPFPSFSFI